MLADSREDKNTTQQAFAGWKEASMASIWAGMVCRMYNADNWKLFESWDT
jgi:hypothetical protein